MDYKDIIIIVLIVALIFLWNERDTTTTTEINTVDTAYIPVHTPPQLIHDTLTKDKVRFTPVFFTDTVVIGNDTTIVTKQPFTAESNTTVFTSGDTLRAKFAYPEFIFSFDYHPKADSVRLITKTNTITIQPSKLTYGIQAGVGVMQSFSGTTNAGGYVGFGLQWNF